MPVSNRAALLAKTVKILGKHYKPVRPAPNRTLFEHLLFACCQENSPAEAAEAVYATLERHYFDWNEVRVSTIRELAEIMRLLNDPEDAARRVRSVLQSVFEAVYAFDLETLKKQNIGQAVKQLHTYAGATPFAISYVVQAALGGHSIPVNEGALQALVIVGAVTDTEASTGRVPGLERALPKSKGIEVGSLLHQWGVDFRCHPYAPATRKVLLEIAPDCKSQLPKRPARQSATGPTTAPEELATETAPAETAPAETASARTASARTAPDAPAASVPEETASGDKPSGSDKNLTAAGKKRVAAGKKDVAAKQTPVDRGDPAKKKTAAKKTSEPARQEKTDVKKKSPVKRLSKRKPR